MTQAWTNMEDNFGDEKKPPLNSISPVDEGDNSPERERLRDTVSNWASDTSAHGFPNVVRSVHIVRKLFWTVAVLAGCGMTIYQVYGLFVTFYSYPVTVSLNMTAANALKFPAVAFCNVNPVRKSMLYHVDQNLASTLPISYGGDDTSILRSHESRAEVKEKFLAEYTLLNASTRFMIGHQKEDMILDCSYDGTKCTAENFTLFQNPQFGNCFIFNSGWGGGGQLVSHKSGEEFGLSLELYLEQSEYLPELTESAGIRMSIIPQNIMPFPQDDGVLVGPGELTFIGLTMLQISRLPDPYPSACWNLGREASTIYSVYSESYDVEYSLPACQKSCYQAHVIGTCGCGDPTLPMTGKAAMRFLKNKTQIIGPCLEDDEPCSDKVKSDYINSLLHCECGIPCQESNYDVTTSSSQWPNDIFADIYYSEITYENPHLKDLIENRGNANSTTQPNAKTFAMSNLAKVQIFFSNLNYEALEELKSYTFPILLADIGGMLGLYLGISIVAIFELIELLFDLTRVTCCKICGK